MNIHAGERLLRTVPIYTQHERHQAVTISGSVRSVGRREVDYVDVPAGVGNLVIQSTAGTYLRITAAPCRSAYPAGWLSDNDEIFSRSIWSLNTDQALGQLAAVDYPASRRWRVAQRMGRDNRYRDGGVQAWNTLRQLVPHYPAHPELGSWAEKAKSAYTVWQPLMPTTGNERLDFDDAWFVTRSLTAPASVSHGPLVSNSLLDDAISSLPGGRFVQIPAAGYILCQLPPDVLDTQFRLAVARDVTRKTAEISVQCDSSSPIRLRLFHDECLPHALQQPSIAEAGLAGLHGHYGPFDAGTLGGPFAARRHAAKQIEAATAELNVACGTRSIRIINHAVHPVRVCLHVRTSREVALSESAFLACLERQPDFSATLLAVIRDQTPQSLIDEDAFQELRNHCVPLLKRLRREQRSFSSGIAVLSEDEPQPSDGGVDPVGMLGRARQLMQQRQWIAALEMWTQLTYKSTRSTRQEAIQARITALLALGESFLAENELRGRILYDIDPGVRADAQLRLADLYRRQGDSEAGERLAAAALLTDPTAERLADLAVAAAENGEWEITLLASLAIRPNQRSQELLLQAAFHQGWWQVFQRTLTQLSDEPQRNYWLAMWWIRQGDFARATQHFALAGERGLSLSNHIARGHEIVRGLRDVDLIQRLAAIRQWEEWWVSHPGPYTWRRDDSLVVTCQRIERVAYEPDDAGSQLYRATPDEPVLLRVNGPIDLQVEVRPLHKLGARESLNDWIVIRGSGREQIWPITGNRPADDLQLLTETEHVPGRKVQTQVRLGPGMHELRVAAEVNDVLVRFARRQPLNSLALLPPITPATIAAVVDGSWGHHALEGIPTHPADSSRWYAHLLVNDTDSPGLVRLPLTRQFANHNHSQRQISPIVTASQRVQLGLRDGTLTALEARRAFTAPAESQTHWRSDEMLELAARADIAPAALTSMADPQWAVDWQWMSVYHGQLLQALRVDPGSDENALHAQIALLARLAEQQPSAQAECAARLAEIAQRDPADGFAAEQLERIKQPGQWILFREVEGSAGLYALEESGPQPLMQSLQVRHALARDVGLSNEPADYLISGYRRLSLDIVESRPVVIELALRQPHIAFMRSPQLQVEVQVDQSAPRAIPMPSSDELQRIQVPLSAGQHRIGVRITNPFAGHYVSLHVYEINASGQRLSWQEQGGEPSAERLYHVATPTIPVQLRVQGPAWIRVERVVEARREIGELAVAQGDREITFAATDGAKNALYRIWEYRFGDAPPEPPPFTESASPLVPTTRWLDQNPLTVMEPSGALRVAPTGYSEALPYPELAALAPADAPVSVVEGLDAFPLSGIGDGTWGFGAAVVSRRALDEGRQFTGDDRFVQLSMSYEDFNPETNTYTMSQGLFRLRDASGPTFGLVHEYWSPLENVLSRWLPDKFCDDQADSCWLDRVNSHHVMSAFLQQPDDPLPFYDAQTEASLGLRSRLYYRYDLTERWYHLPSLTFIARWLSLDRTSYVPSRVDQDIFTPFKNDQRVGFYLTDTWIHEPSESGKSLAPSGRLYKR